MHIPDKGLLPDGFVRDMTEESFGEFDDIALEEERLLNE
jgi:hypothetical protein